MHRDEQAGAPTPVGAATHSVGEPTPAVEDPTPSRELTVEPIAEPTPFAIAITDAEELFAASTPLEGRRAEALLLAAHRSAAAASIAIAHMLQRLVQAVESGTLELGELVVDTTEWADHGAEQVRLNGKALDNAAEFQREQVEHMRSVRHALGEEKTDPSAN